jgi:hypothetical protein
MIENLECSDDKQMCRILLLADSLKPLNGFTETF